MRNNKSYPNQMKTRLFSEVEKALKAGVREVVLCLPGVGFRRRTVRFFLEIPSALRAPEKATVSELELIF